ncbi:F0F1 ATP synthase subunit B [Williamwhitmania taraxaci]|uniref:ATP synthase subunit b n=1 Tax=Williamwhitmania taraxaci TaxID=1640674 RepID=A0A1G6GYM3_9BACT|nr:F0F1 ATP synthase subunit B [Williamwhitmania taraxaci]SDB87061.1 ATP synthase F0 subcomplex B subunit [Williamwhitmania taraxaci]
MELLIPEVGLIFWMLLSFSFLLFILGKYAWPIILSSLKKREDYIRESLITAHKAQDDYYRLQKDGSEILNKARVQQEEILMEARNLKETMLADARIIAQEETKRQMELAKVQIQLERDRALADLKKQAALLSVDIAEEILKRELVDSKEQDRLIQQLLDNVKLN